MAEAIYVLCALTSAACCLLLLRTYLKNRTRFLLWSSLGFFGLFANNVVLVIDRVVLPDADLFAWRAATALVGLGALLWGLIWTARD